VAMRLREIAKDTKGMLLGYRAHIPEVHVSLTAPGSHASDFNPMVARIADALGQGVYSDCGRSIAEVVVNRLQERGETLALAESCTGGKIGDLITDVPGSSAVFLGGFTVYSYQAKS